MSDLAVGDVILVTRGSHRDYGGGINFGDDSGSSSSVWIGRIRVIKGSPSVFGVEFDKPYPGAGDLDGLCKAGYGNYFREDSLKKMDTIKNVMLLRTKGQKR